MKTWISLARRWLVLTWPTPKVFIFSVVALLLYGIAAYR